MQRKKSTKCYIALLTWHHKISVHDAAIYHELPGFSHCKWSCPPAETVRTVGLYSSYLVFHNWYVGMMYGMYSYLVFYITIWIEHVLYFLTKER